MFFQSTTTKKKLLQNTPIPDVANFFLCLSVSATEIYRALKLCLDSLSSSVIGDISNTFQPPRQETKGESLRASLKQRNQCWQEQSGGRE